MRSSAVRWCSGRSRWSSSRWSTGGGCGGGGGRASGSAWLGPIAPLARVSRPLVLGQEQVVELEVVDREALLSLDGGDPREVKEGGKIEIRLSPRSVRIGRTDDWSWWRAVRRTFL